VLLVNQGRLDLQERQLVLQLVLQLVNQGRLDLPMTLVVHVLHRLSRDSIAGHVGSVGT
jgi:hypothetical protein